jgi:UDP-N-acetylglucosamine diphosphorylase/glucosamine-1-phosphate N-acetyltransferase
MRVCLFEHHAETLDPIALTRPMFDLRCGLLTLGEKLRRAFHATAWSAWVRPMLVDLVRQEHPGVPVNDPNFNASLWVNARWLAPDTCCRPPGGPCAGVLDGEVAWVLVSAAGRDLDAILESAGEVPSHPAGGAMVRYPWDLVDRNAAEISRDVAAVSTLPASQPANLIVVGPPDRVFIHHTARLDPLVVLDTTHGPIVLQEGVVVAAFSRIEGPCVVGPRTQIMGAKIRGGVTIGPQCRIGGEVETSIVHGYSNKYHEGFLGHSYLGEWVNLGAGTHTSDLRNDYGEVEVTIDGRRVATGRSKVGCFLGDHTKTGLGSLINTGTNIGPFCNVLPAGRFAPKHMPAFTTWWNGHLRLGFPMPQLLITAQKVMERRGETLTPSHVALYEKLWEATDPLRCRVLAESEQKMVRRSA